MKYYKCTYIEEATAIYEETQFIFNIVSKLYHIGYKHIGKDH